MKLLLSFVFISVANAASQNGSFIRGGSSAEPATHVVPGDIFAGLQGRRTCDKSSQCHSDEFCEQSCGQTGQCGTMPNTCSKNYDPVCGCDNKTYDNACVASVQGRTSVKFYGKCNSNRNKCNRNSDCQSNEYCNFPDRTCGGNGGLCKPIPSGQDCNGVTNDKVCGCDNVQYKNSCKANQSRTSIQNMGNCSNEDFAFE